MSIKSEQFIKLYRKKKKMKCKIGRGRAGRVVVTSLPFLSRDTDKYLSPVLERPQGLHSPMQMLMSSSTSCFKYFVIMKLSKFC